MTATHGTGMDYGNLATLVVCLEMVTASGEVMTICKGDDHDLFDVVTVSLGFLGIVTQIKFQVENAFNLKEITTVMTLEECDDQNHDLMESHEYTRL